MTTDELIKREEHRQEYIAKAIKLAEDELARFPDVNPDVIAYLHYKVGAAILMKGVQNLDKRVMMADIGAVKLEHIDIGQGPTEAPRVLGYGFCKCGRPLGKIPGEPEDNIVCSGCFSSKALCDCKKLSTHDNSQATLSTLPPI